MTSCLGKGSSAVLLLAAVASSPGMSQRNRAAAAAQVVPFCASRSLGRPRDRLRRAGAPDRLQCDPAADRGDEPVGRGDRQRARLLDERRRQQLDRDAGISTVPTSIRSSSSAPTSRIRSRSTAGTSTGPTPMPTRSDARTSTARRSRRTSSAAPATYRESLRDRSGTAGRLTRQPEAHHRVEEPGRNRARPLQASRESVAS